MKTAVLIQTHKNAKYILALGRRYKDIRFYIHVDKKSDPVYSEIKKNMTGNIFLIEDRCSVYWGGSSQYKATLKLINAAYENKDNEYFHLVSGECVPLIDFNEMERLWAPGTNYIECKKRKDTEWRLKIKVFYSDSDFIRTFVGRILNRLHRYVATLYNFTGVDVNAIFYGSQWFSINRDFVSKIVLVYKEKIFFDFFENISCSDEHVFQMLAKSLHVSVNENNKRYIVFREGNNSPEYLSSAQLISAGENGYWFARKLHENNLIDFIEKDNG